MAKTLLGLLLAVVLSVHAQTVLRSLQVHDPRDYGYHLGDQIERRIVLELNHSYRLETSVLPEPGRLDDWFELAGLDIEQSEIDGGIQYILALRYQIMNIQTERQTLSIPALMLSVRAGEQTLGFQVPPLALTIAAVSNLQPGNTVLQAAMAPDPIDLGFYRGSVLAASCLLFGASLGWLVLHGYALGLAQRTGPFASAYRQLRRQEYDAAQARRIVHQAFDQTAGRTVFTSELPRLWGEQPWLRPHKAAIEAFYADSQRFFYQQTEASEALSTADLMALCRVCRQLESGR